MARPDAGTVFVGLKHSVVALDRRTGTERWRTRLQPGSSGSPFVTVVRDGDLLFAAYSGELFCLDPKSGALLWQNPLKGLGLGLASIAGEQGGSSSLAETMAEELRRREAAAAAATA